LVKITAKDLHKKIKIKLKDLHHTANTNELA